MNNQDLKAVQIQLYKNLVSSYLKTLDDAPWKEAQHIKLEGLSAFLKATGVLTDELENDIIQQSRKEAQQ